MSTCKHASLSEPDPCGTCTGLPREAAHAYLTGSPPRSTRGRSRAAPSAGVAERAQRELENRGSWIYFYVWLKLREARHCSGLTKDFLGAAGCRTISDGVLTGEAIAERGIIDG